MTKESENHRVETDADFEILLLGENWEFPNLNPDVKMKPIPVDGRPSCVSVKAKDGEVLSTISVSGDENWRATVDFTPNRSGIDDPEEDLQVISASDCHSDLKHDDFPMRALDVVDF